MIGEQITNLCKTLSIMDNLVQMGGELKVVDPQRVMLMEVKSLDGSQVFGIESDKMLKVKEMLQMKIPSKWEFNVKVEAPQYVLRNEVAYFGFSMIEPETPDKIRVPKLDGLLQKVEVSGKALRDFMKHVPKGCESVGFSIEDGDVWMNADGMFQKILGMKIASTDRDVNIVSKFDPDYMKKLVNVVGSTVTLGLGPDYPMTAEWCDAYYEYKVLLAPRITRGD